MDPIDIATQPLPPCTTGAAMLRDRLAAAGVTWHLGTSVKVVDNDGDGVRVTLASGATIAAGIVLSAIGLKPKTALAQAAGLKIGRGIAVGRHLETSVADIHALGDCAEVEGLVLPFIMPITHAARALAGALAGKPAPLSSSDARAGENARVPDHRVPASGRRHREQVTEAPDGVKSLSSILRASCWATR